jgi:hypothetical protein
VGKHEEDVMLYDSFLDPSHVVERVSNSNVEIRTDVNLFFKLTLQRLSNRPVVRTLDRRIVIRDGIVRVGRATR